LLKCDIPTTLFDVGEHRTAFQQIGVALMRVPDPRARLLRRYPLNHSSDVSVRTMGNATG